MFLEVVHVQLPDLSASFGKLPPCGPHAQAMPPSVHAAAQQRYRPICCLVRCFCESHCVPEPLLHLARVASAAMHAAASQVRNVLQEAGHRSFLVLEKSLLSDSLRARAQARRANRSDSCALLFCRDCSRLKAQTGEDGGAWLVLRSLLLLQQKALESPATCLG
ncbi:unnamed protein product [Symbiodinium natans]|uniref:Uncharacterized protein n=1 Tax=Symbiodinium natans TaxID=878477 RepID=A0A812UJ93_9DINO|nr:unnamed protein product [Symbiodinium natans]